MRDVFEKRARGKVLSLLKNQPASCFAMTRTLVLFPALLASAKSGVSETVLLIFFTFRSACACVCVLVSLMLIFSPLFYKRYSYALLTLLQSPLVLNFQKGTSKLSLAGG